MPGQYKKDIETCHRVIDKCPGINKKCHDISNANARLDIKYLATNICEKNIYSEKLSKG